jgi:GDPmannose 4,6-dehydratase
MKKTALITGINGQDGSYLAELLLEKGYDVWGILKRNSVAETQSARIEHLRDKKLITLEYADMLDMSSLIRVLQLCNPDEIYNLAAQSHVRISFDQPIYTTHSIATGTLNLLESMRLVCPKAKMYQASSSEMFGNNVELQWTQYLLMVVLKYTHIIFVGIIETPMVYLSVMVYYSITNLHEEVVILSLIRL